MGLRGLKREDNFEETDIFFYVERSQTDVWGGYISIMTGLPDGPIYIIRALELQ